MIRTVRYFVITIVISIFVVWLSNYPGNVEIIWSQYLIQTNLIGLVIILISFTSLVLFIYVFLKKIKEIPGNFSRKKKEKYLYLGNEALNEIAINLALNNSEDLERNSRKLKKYFENNLFSTFMLFFSSLMKNDIAEAKKYLKILEGIPKADYIAKRSNVLITLKQGNYDEAEEILKTFCEEYPKDTWFFEKLSSLHSVKKDWLEASKVIQKVGFSKSPKIKNLIANLKIFTGDEPPDALRISNRSINVIIEVIKFYLDKSDVKKASSVVEKNWSNFYCLDIVKTFVSYKIEDNSDSLRRFKLISKVLKNSFNKSSESKLALAYAAYEASMWGESQQNLDLIPLEDWDSRVKELYEDLSKKSLKIKIPMIPDDIKMEPLWSCEICDSKYKKWEFICKTCENVNTLNWPKSKLLDNQKRENELLNILLKNPLSHLPKMK